MVDIIHDYPSIAKLTHFGETRPQSVEVARTNADCEALFRLLWQKSEGPPNVQETQAHQAPAKAKG